MQHKPMNEANALMPIAPPVVALESQLGEFLAQEADDRLHAGDRHLGVDFGLGVVVGVGIDVVSVDLAVFVGDELDAGDLDAVLGQ